jgi:hypothetical protein
VFWLHNFAYDDARCFEDVDRVIVPSEFSKQWYQQRLGLECRVLPYLIDWGRVSCEWSVVSGVAEESPRSPVSITTFVYDSFGNRTTFAIVKTDAVRMRPADLPVDVRPGGYETIRQTIPGALASVACLSLKQRVRAKLAVYAWLDSKLCRSANASLSFLANRCT